MIRDGVVDLAAAAMAGLGRARRYRGLLLATYLVQLLLSLIPAALVFALLLPELASEPALGRAVDGDISAIIEVLRAVPSAPLAAVVAVLVTALAYVAISWFLTAGLLGAYRDQPEGAAAAARSFGAHGARRVFAFARLFALTAPLYAALAVWAALAIGDVAERLTEVVTAGELARALIENLAGPALVLWLVWTAVDHARVELVEDEHLAAWRAMFKGVARVLRRPVCAAHTALGHVAVALFAVGYLGVAGLGLSGLGLLLLRQLFGLARHFVHLAIIAGQVELGSRIRRQRR